MPIDPFPGHRFGSVPLKMGKSRSTGKRRHVWAFFESYVFSEIYKSYLNAGKEPPIFYYRDKDQKEIDLLLYQNGVLSPIEIKKSASPGKAAIKNFKVLEPVTKEYVFGGLESLKVEVGPEVWSVWPNDLLPVDEKELVRTSLAHLISILQKERGPNSPRFFYADLYLAPAVLLSPRRPDRRLYLHPGYGRIYQRHCSDHYPDADPQSGTETGDPGTAAVP